MKATRRIKPDTLTLGILGALNAEQAGVKMPELLKSVKIEYHALYNRLDRLRTAGYAEEKDAFWRITEKGREFVVNALNVKAREANETLTPSMPEQNRAHRYEIGIDMIDAYPKEVAKTLDTLHIQHTQALRWHEFTWQGYELMWSGPKLRAKSRIDYPLRYGTDVSVYKLDKDAIDDLLAVMLSFEQELQKEDARFKLKRFHNGELAWYRVRNEIAHSPDVFAKQAVEGQQKLVLRDPIDNKPDIGVDASWGPEVDFLHKEHAPKSAEEYRQFRNTFKSPKEYARFLQAFRIGEFPWREMFPRLAKIEELIQRSEEISLSTRQELADAAALLKKALERGKL